ncbi:MAG: hypothetical protein KA791_07020, partial [Flavobacteriales bacterium]|nr:hypothetical protein [Flavobacteriales bacterium]
MITLTKAKTIATAKDTLVLLKDPARLRDLQLERNDRQYLVEQLGGDATTATCDISGRLVIVHRVRDGKRGAVLEKARCAGNEMVAKLIAAKREEAQLISLQNDADLT